MTAAGAEPLRDAARALSLPITDQQVEILLAFVALLQKWNQTYNLTAVRDPASMLTQHVVDSLAVVGPLLRETSATPIRLLDVGSGGGLPGVVLAVMAPQVAVTCVDSVGKKAAFIRQAAGELRLPNLVAVHSRVEQMLAKRMQVDEMHVDQTRVDQMCSDPFDIVTARAFASLDDLVRLTSDLLHANGVWMAMKGKRPALEIAALDPSIDVFHVEQLDVPGMDAERCLVWMRRRRPQTTRCL